MANDRSYPRENGARRSSRPQRADSVKGKPARSRTPDKAPPIDRAAVGQVVRKNVLRAKEEHEKRLPEASGPKQWAMNVLWHATVLKEDAIRLSARPPADEVVKLRGSMEAQATQLVVWCLEILEEIELRKQSG